MTRGFDGSRVFRTGVKSKIAVVLEEERERERAEKGYRFVWFNCDGSVDQEEGDVACSGRCTNLLDRCLKTGMNGMDIELDSMEMVRVNEESFDRCGRFNNFLVTVVNDSCTMIYLFIP